MSLWRNQTSSKKSSCRGLKCLSDNRGATLKVCHLWLVGPDLSHVSLSSRRVQRVGFTPGLSVQKSKIYIFILNVSINIVDHFLFCFVFLKTVLSLSQSIRVKSFGWNNSQLKCEDCVTSKSISLNLWCGPWLFISKGFWERKAALTIYLPVCSL